MLENLQKVLENFLEEAGGEAIGTGIVDFDGKTEAYATHGTFDKDYNVQRSASTFAMIVNVLNKTLGGIYMKDDEVDEILVTSKNGLFLLGVIKTEKCFQGVTVTRGGDIEKIRELIKKYKPLFLDQVK